MISAILLCLILGILIFLFAGKVRQASKTSFDIRNFPSLLSFSGTIESGPYLTIGLILFFVKHNMDRIWYWQVYRKFPLLDELFVYLQPFRHGSFQSQLDREYFLGLLCISLPFIYIGVVFTIKRLRSLQLPLWLVVLFFVPFLNLIFFLTLSLLSGQSSVAQSFDSKLTPLRKFLDRMIPRGKLECAVMAIFVGSVLGALGMIIMLKCLSLYGVSLFVLGPFALGLISALIYGYHQPRSIWDCLSIAWLTIWILGIATLALAIEGAICILMAIPLALIMGVFGAWVGYFIQRRPGGNNDAARTIALLILAIPFITGAEYLSNPQAPITPICTRIIINAPVETVWKNVIAFPDLPAPKEWMFRHGIAYPTHAEISGTGVGAMRECHFSTGSFKEPITIWQENNLLRFDVVSQPEPMVEWTPYKNIRPPHLDNYLVSKHGQFLLTKLPDGRVQLEGTTWYSNKMWPQSYWRLWSDAIIHKIHERVLNHIKTVSETSGD